jgi:hypothetical protein
VTAATAEMRNRFMIAMADEVVVGYASEGGMLDQMMKESEGKQIYRIVE